MSEKQLYWTGSSCLLLYFVALSKNNNKEYHIITKNNPKSTETGHKFFYLVPNFRFLTCKIYFLEYRPARLPTDLSEIGFWKEMCRKFILRELFESSPLKCILGSLSTQVFETQTATGREHFAG